MSREVPEGWRRSQLGDLIKLEYGKALSGAQRREGTVPVFGSSGIVGYHDKAAATGPSIVISRKGSLGGVFYVEGDFWPIDTTYFVMQRQSCDWRWLTYLLKFASLERLNEATGVPGLNRDKAAKEQVFVPPLHEQHRIAETLSSVDEAIAATRAVIEQTRKVKQGVLERLLTKGIGHTRFKQTEIGEIPEGWRIGTLGSITLGLEAGVSVNSENRPKQPGEIGILKTSCVSAGIFDPDEHKTVLLGERDRVKIPVRGDRIIISRMNTPNLVGANGYVENDIADLFLPDRLWQLSTSENARWLACLLASDQSRERLSAIATGTSGSMKNISKSKLLDLLFAIPSQAEQQEIASIIQEIDASIEADSRTMKGQIATKSALMSDLLTGRKRVTDTLPMAAE